MISSDFNMHRLHKHGELSFINVNLKLCLKWSFCYMRTDWENRKQMCHRIVHNAAPVCSEVLTGWSSRRPCWGETALKQFLCTSATVRSPAQPHRSVKLHNFLLPCEHRPLLPCEHRPQGSRSHNMKFTLTSEYNLHLHLGTSPCPLCEQNLPS